MVVTSNCIAVVTESIATTFADKLDIQVLDCPFTSKPVNYRLLTHNRERQSPANMCNLENEAVPIIDAYWEGPYSSDALKKLKEIKEHCLYQIYGSHPVYGCDSLLYIGMSKRDEIFIRLEEHTWIQNQADLCQIYIASCGNFAGWKAWNKDERKRYDRYDFKSITLSAIESLLIYAHQPSYTSAGLKSTSFAAKPFRLFNTGKRALLLPEISTQFYSDSKQALPLDLEQS
ncbi:hypothetical protein GCM10007855_09560 [Aliivibrio sifiae]|uniref:GIY-YIG nuclease family protein n=1 Tax=Aliivibrio sifiae TaxID=566293 RepID=A0ABQ6AF98_9GAMM|nr:hypothetical protein GCM10007855_09560 [Aliivibrio sifiae]